MSFDIFKDGARLKDVREGALNPLIDYVNKTLTPDVTKLKTDLAAEQVKTAEAYKDTTLDLANSRLVFTRLDNSTDNVDLTSLISLIDHGIYVGDKTGQFVNRFPKLEFDGATVASKPAHPDTVVITIPQPEPLYGNTSGTSEPIKTIVLSGNKGASHITGDVMYIELPDGGVVPPPVDPIQGEVEGGTAKNLKKVKVEGNVTGSSMADDGTLTIHIPPQSGTATITGQVNGSSSGEITKIFVDGQIGTSAVDHGTLKINLPNVTAGIGGNTQQQLKTITLQGDVSSSGMENGNLTIGLSSGGGGGTASPLKVGIKGKTPVSDVGEIYFEGAEVSVGQITKAGNKVLVTHKGTPTKIDGANEKYVKKIDITGNTTSTSVSDDGVLTLNIPAGGSGGSINAQIKTDPEAPIDLIQLTGDVNDSIITGNKLIIDMKRGGTGSDTIKGQIENNDPKDINTVQVIGAVSGSVMENDKLTINVPRPLVVNAQIDDSSPAPISNVKLTGNNSTSMIKDGTLTIDLPASGGGGTSTPLKGQVGNTGAEGDVAKVFISGNTVNSSLTGNVLTIDIPDIPTGGTSFFVGFFDNLNDLKNANPNPVEERSYGYVKYTDPTHPTITYNVPYMYAQGDWRVVATKPPITYTTGTGTNPVTVTSIKEDPKITINNFGEMDLSGLSDTSPVYFRGYFESLDELNGESKPSERIEDKTYAFVRQEASVTTPGAERQLLMYMWRKTGHQTTPDWKITAPAGSLALVNGDTYKPIFGINLNPMIERDTDGVVTILDTSVPKVHNHIMNVDGTAIVTDAPFQHMKWVDGEAVTEYNATDKNFTVYRAQRRLDMGQEPDQTSQLLTEPKYEGSIFLNTRDHHWWGFADKDADASKGEKKWTRIIHPNMSWQVESLDRRLPAIIPSIVDGEVNPTTKDHKAWMESGWTHARKESVVLPEEVRNKTGGYIETYVITDASAQGGHHRYQMLYVETDAATYKRYWVFDPSGGQQANKWSEWVKTSFNPQELAAHNNDEHAHRKAHLFYKTVTFECLYSEIKTAGSWVPISALHYLGSSNGRHNVNDDQFVTVQYNGKYRCRGHIYFSGASQVSDKMKGTWFIYLDKRVKDGPWGNAYTASYLHHSTSLQYPPLRWDARNMDLKAGDQLRIGFRFQPDPGITLTDWEKAFPNIGFHGLRSFVSVDEEGNDGGFSLGETHRKLHGRLAVVGDYGINVFKDTSTSRIRVVGNDVKTNVTEMTP